MTATATAATPDIDALKTRLKATWMDGNYDYFSRFMESSAAELLDRVGVQPGASLLDVACGSGQLALIAARRGARVAGIDIATNAILAARGRATAEGLDARFDEGDAEDLPYADASFDVVASIYGAMFAPRPERVAAELLRVCRPGGRIGLANWMPTEYGGDLFRALAKYVPPPPGVKPPVRWGTEDGLRELMGSGTRAIQAERRVATLYYRSPDHMFETLRTFFGPIVRALQMVDAASQAALQEDVLTVLRRYNRATDGTAAIEAAYLQVIATRA